MRHRVGVGVAGQRVPLAAEITAANVHDKRAAVPTVDAIVELDELLKQSSEQAGRAPCLKPSVTRRSRPELVRQCLPLRTGSQPVNDAGKDCSIRNRWSTSPGSGRRRRKQHLDLAPQCVGDLRELVLHRTRRSRHVCASNACANREPRTENRERERPVTIFRIRS